MCPKPPLGGTWNAKTSTCTLPNPDQLPVDTTLKIGSGVTLTIGTFTNLGTIENSGIITGNPTAILLTGPVFDNEKSGVMNVQGFSITNVTGLFRNYGLVETGTFNILVGGSSTNEAGGTFQNIGGSVYVFGTFYNFGSLATQPTDPQVFVYGNLENFAVATLTGARTIVYSGGSLTNLIPGNFTLSGSFLVNGTVTNNAAATMLINSATTIAGKGLIKNAGVMTTNATVYDLATFETTGTGSLDNLATLNMINGLLINQGLTNNTGAIYNYGDCTQNPNIGIISNYATLINSGDITNGGGTVCAKFLQFHTGIFINSGYFGNANYSSISGNFTNSGTIQASVGMISFNTTTFTNTAAGSIFMGSEGKSTIIFANDWTNAGEVNVGGGTGSSINMTKGLLINTGNIVNSGTMTFTGSASVENFGTITDNGYLYWKSSGTLIVESGATIINYANFYYTPPGGSGLFLMNGNLTTSGYVLSTGDLSIGGQFNVTSGTFFIANGTTIVSPGGYLNNFALTNNTGALVNSGFIVNYGTIVSSIGSWTNSGEVFLESLSSTTVNSILYNQIIFGVNTGFYLFPSANLYLGGGTLINSGNLQNQGIIYIDSTGSITNYGTMNNTNEIENEFGNGNVTNVCDGTLFGGGRIDNPPLVQACAPPSISYPKKGDLIYNTSFVINGTSNPLAQITVYSGRDAVGTTTANATGFWTVSTTSLSTGNNDLSAIASGVDGNSSASKTVKVDILRSTSTTLSCIPASLPAGKSTTCTATVTDTSSGTTLTPKGTVSFSSNLTGTFSSTACTLVKINSSSASCSVTFTPTSTGAAQIAAQYTGDSYHISSDGDAEISVS